MISECNFQCTSHLTASGKHQKGQPQFLGHIAAGQTQVRLTAACEGACNVPLCVTYLVLRTSTLGIFNFLVFQPVESVLHIPASAQDESDG